MPSLRKPSGLILFSSENSYASLVYILPYGELLYAPDGHIITIPDVVRPRILIRLKSPDTKTTSKTDKLFT